MLVSIIVACDPLGVIGKDNKLPWRVPEDLQMFRKRTLGHCIIMGRKTWQSLPKKPLDGRVNIVISRTTSEASVATMGPHWFGSIDTALWAIQGFQGELREYKDREVFLIGGAELYRTALDRNLVDRIIMSKIRTPYDGNVYFPKLDDKWQTTTVEYYKDFDLWKFSQKNPT